MDIISSYKETFRNNSSQDNTLQRNLDNNSFENQNLSNITPNNISSDTEMTIIKEIKNEIKNIIISYPNKDEIPLINIKDENFFESGERIDNYINSLTFFDDSKFNKCKICKENLMIFFVKIVIKIYVIIAIKTACLIIIF